MKRTIAVPTLVLLLLPVAFLSLPLAAQEGETPMPSAQPQAPAPPANLSPPADAQRTASGLAYKVLEPGTGENHPDGNDLVVVQYTGWNAEDGSVFDSSVARGKPALLPIEALIQGWTEGLQLMTEGAKWRLWIPGNLAYAGIEGRPQGMLVFDVELLEVRRIPDPPEHLTEPAPDATIEESGLAWKVLEPGSGEEHAGPGDKVKVNYIVWTPKGQWIDASYAKGTPATLDVDSLIEGWKLALAEMVPGEKRRLWVPARLAYENDPSKPQGPLIFDLKLIEINPQPEDAAP